MLPPRTANGDGVCLSASQDLDETVTRLEVRCGSASQIEHAEGSEKANSWHLIGTSRRRALALLICDVHTTITRGLTRRM
jgi:hypothetical protein